MTNKERKKEISKQPIPTKEECLAFYKELTNLASARFVPYYKMAIEALEKEPVLDKIKAEIKGWQVDIHDNENDADKHDFVFERIFEIFDEYTTESENSVTNKQISKIKTEYFVVDDYGYSDKGLVDKVNELIDKVNELTAQMQQVESEGKQ